MANEKRLIDAYKLEDLLQSNSARYHNKDDVIAAIVGQPTVDAVEAHEYDAIVNKLECLLCHATGGQYSKAGYSLEDMERMVTDYIEECCEEAAEEVVVHGLWKEGYVIHKYGCSCCGVRQDKISPYCPNCGAKMDGDGNG